MNTPLSTSPTSTQDELPSQNELADLVAQLLAEARRSGATAAEAAVSCSNGLSVGVRMAEVETLQHHRSRGLGITVYFGQRKGSANTSDWKPQALRDTVAAACDIARYTEADPCAGLADSERLAQHIPELDLYHPWPLETAKAITQAQACEAAARAHDKRIANSDGANLSTGSGLMYYGTSHGFSAGYPTSRHALSCVVIAQDDSGMQTGNWYTVARDPKALQDSEAVGLEAARRAVRRLGAQRLGTRQAPVLLVPEIARGFLSHLIGAISGSALYRKASFMRDQLGQAVLPDWLSLREQPHLPKALASVPFDSEGVATVARDLVKHGVLQAYVLDSYSARRLGMETTGNAGGIHNLIVTPGGTDFDDLVKQMDTGLVVTHLMGQGVNLLTGDYSRGASGFWVERGEIQYPVEEITIAGNLRKMLRTIVAHGSDIDTRGAIRCGSLLLDTMTIAGK